MARIYRELPLLSIWEGSGNVAALDALRAMGREPQSVEAFFGEVELAAGADHRLDDAVAAVKKELADLEDVELRARRIVEQLALVLQGSLLVRHAPPRWPTPSAPPASAATGAAPSAPSPPASTSPRSSTERWLRCPGARNERRSLETSEPIGPGLA